MESISHASITIVNPLAGALEHYSGVLSTALTTDASTVSVVSLSEPSRGGGSPVSWLVGYVRALLGLRRRARSGGEIVVVTWPVLGYLDVVILRLLLGRRARAHVIVHDPEPLVRAVGYSPAARWLARVSAGRSCVLVQSTAAREVVDMHGLREAAVTLPHPIGPTRSAGPSGHSAVRVLGQYKGDRDVELLVEIAKRLHGERRLEVHGRGWPAVSGWTVVEGFVSEDRFDELVASSSTVLIPYQRFYQSGVALRCLKMATPVIGPRESSLADYFGADGALLVPTAGRSLAERAHDWVRAIDRADEFSEEELRQLSERAQERSSLAWQEWLAVA